MYSEFLICQKWKAMSKQVMKIFWYVCYVLLIGTLRFNFYFNVLEIKPYGLGSRIWRLKATTDLLIGECLDYFLFLFVSITGTVGWTER